MAVVEQKLSPEEKLLKVIQGGGEAEKTPTPEEKMLAAVKPAAAAAPTPAPKPVPAKPPESAKPAAAPAAKPAPAATPIPAASPAAAPKAEPPKKAAEARPAEPVKKAEPGKEEKKSPEPKAAAPAPEDKPSDKAQDKPKLKVLKPEPAAAGNEPPAKPMIGAPESGVIGAGGQVAVSGKGRSHRKFTMGVVNQGLAAAVLLILALTGYEIWAAVRDASSVAKAPVALPKPPDAAAEEPVKLDDQPPLANVIEEWEKKVIFSSVGGELEKPTGGGNPPPQPIPDNRLKLMGFSKASDEQAKVILWDTTDARMFIVRVGEKILVGEQQWEVIQIKDDQVVLSNGRDSISLK